MAADTTLAGLDALDLDALDAVQPPSVRRASVGGAVAEAGRHRPRARSSGSWSTSPAGRSRTSSPARRDPADLWRPGARACCGTRSATPWHAAVIGYALALVIGTVVGLLVARIPPLRAAIGSLITGLQTMPSVAWIPFAIISVRLNDARDPVHHRDGRGAVDRQRRHRRRGLHPAAAAAGRARSSGCAGWA